MRNRLTFDIVAHMLPAQRDAIDKLLLPDAESLSTTGATLSLDIEQSNLVVSGTMAMTLPAPTVIGQKKTIVCQSAASSPACTVTITSPDNTTGFVCAGSFFFDTAGQAVYLVATPGLLWRAVRIERAGSSGVNGVIVGTTVLTGKNLWKTYCLSVTATVSSTGTMALPNGSAVGEECMLTCSTAASTPVGSIDGVYVGFINDAYTHAGAIGVVGSATATGDYALLRWTGAAWQVLNQSGITFS